MGHIVGQVVVGNEIFWNPSTTQHYANDVTTREEWLIYIITLYTTICDGPGRFAREKVIYSLINNAYHYQYIKQNSQQIYYLKKIIHFS